MRSLIRLNYHAGIIPAFLYIATAATPIAAASDITTVLRGAAIGAAVTATAPQLNSAINTVTLQHSHPAGTSTKVVPIISIGEKGYVGGAQVSGPSAEVNRVRAIWQYENNFSNNEFRIKALVPTASLNPLQFQKVEKVGITALVDVSLDGRWRGQTYSRNISTGDVLKAGVVMIAINAAANPLNSAINSITGGLGANTKVVPIASVGDKAYIGGVQISGPAAIVGRTQMVYQYEDLFDSGRYRIRALVPTESMNPLQFSRSQGVGITALIDTSVASQQRVNERRAAWGNTRTNYPTIGAAAADRFRADLMGTNERRDRGLHLGWYIGVGNQRKQIDGKWYDRYRALSPREQELFVVWWNRFHNAQPSVQEREYNKWLTSVRQQSKPAVGNPGNRGNQNRNSPGNSSGNQGRGRGNR